MAAFLLTLTFTACGDDDDDDDDSGASTYEEEADEDEEEGSINGHEYVDLGLSVKWATCNVGADHPEEYGDYYAWGETETKESYGIDNCETFYEDIDDISGTDRDVAHVMWGGTWRMPTRDEINELDDNCRRSWTTLHGVEGAYFKKNDNSIFIPAAGRRSGTARYGVGESGYILSSTPYPADGSQDAHTTHAFYLWFDDNGCASSWSKYRYVGMSVRPVSD